MSDLPIAAGKGINPADFPEEQFELYSIPSHETGRPEVIFGREIGSNKQIVEPQTVLLSKINPRINRTWLIGAKGNRRQIASTEWIAFDRCEAVDPKYLKYFMQQADFRDFLAANASGVGGSLMRIKPATLKGFIFRAPGTATQRRIVEKLEELLSDLDAGVAELKAAQRKLAAFRQSLLKAAVEGTLTADWRAARANDGTSQETGADLLQRILAERRARWEQNQLARFAAQGKTPPKAWQNKYPEPAALDPDSLPALPEGWIWATVDQLSHSVRNGLSQKPAQSPPGYPILRINAVRALSVDLTEVRYLAVPSEAAEPYLISEGDLLATRYNGSVDLLGVVGVVRGLSGPMLHPDKLIRIQPALSPPLADWIELAAATGASRSHVLARVKTTAGQTGISGADLKKMPIPLPPITEQLSACEKVSEALSGVGRQEAMIEESLNQAAAQRRNILKAAFAGQLVPQDAADEPASVLLERIRATRADRGPTTRKRGRKARENA
jgi:type I restriction enzyme S subunit